MAWTPPRSTVHRKFPLDFLDGFVVEGGLTSWLPVDQRYSQPESQRAGRRKEGRRKERLASRIREEGGVKRRRSSVLVPAPLFISEGAFYLRPPPRGVLELGQPHSVVVPRSVVRSPQTTLTPTQCRLCRQHPQPSCREAEGEV